MLRYHLQVFALTPPEVESLKKRGLMKTQPDWRKQTPKNIRSRDFMRRLRKQRSNVGLRTE